MAAPSTSPQSFPHAPQFIKSLLRYLEYGRETKSMGLGEQPGRTPAVNVGGAGCPSIPTVSIRSAVDPGLECGHARSIAAARGEACSGGTTSRWSGGFTYAVRGPILGECACAGIWWQERKTSLILVVRIALSADSSTNPVLTTKICVSESQLGSANQVERAASAYRSIRRQRSKLPQHPHSIHQERSSHWFLDREHGT
ncbi:hypothetical protein CALVIDRAFT_582933 [Calocera viscosa TUFC12733]|uniref:Uncharacterized protein n=1 Tax=Calocera viscosa (strain TUFC12733) TaxID=1330018 RepID=A0A167JFI7_CALVF|nr:hypothetical protein CALVIDRAFT_582933 [Calocera viscosa TUFC12733]